ncbi:hypothetical protein HDV02_003972 [Globomyces sp. JEL0801]|nr:hypothetical protein HDV02_003972 [Globomyces sp. JEL0801]
MESLDEEFENAVATVSQLSNQIPNAELLKLYGLYKQATGAYSEWKALEDVDQESAKESYIASVSLLSSNDKKEAMVSVSVMSAPSSNLQDSEKSLFDLTKEGNLDAIKQRIELGTSFSTKDNNGMTILHWSSDRGHQDIIEYLIGLGMDVNDQDSELNTALHYSAIAGHDTICTLLLQAGARPDILNSDGETYTQLHDSS